MSTTTPAGADKATDELPHAEQVLRRLLAYRVAGARLYADDGELQDNTAQPCIDFRRDSVDAIETALGQRSLAAFNALPPEDVAALLRGSGAVFGAGAPVQQSQPDNSEVPYMIVFDDQDQENELVIGDWRAAIRFKQISGSWNAHLFVKIAGNSRDDKTPCYAPASTVVARPDLSSQQEPKYGGTLFNRESGEPIPPDEPVFIFRARDRHAARAIGFYAGDLRNAEHFQAVYQRVRDFNVFAAAHPERMKEPDTAIPAPQAPDQTTGEKK